MPDATIPPQLLRALRDLQRQGETGEFCVHLAAGSIAKVVFHPLREIIPLDKSKGPAV